MKLAYNPLGLGAYTPAPSYENDIIFDLVTKITYVKGVPFYGKKYEYFKKHTSPDNTGGSEGLVPAPSYTTTNTRLLREDGEWVHVSGASPPDSMLDANSTNTVENQAITKEIQKINDLLILKAEHVYKNIVVNDVLIQALGTNDTLEFVQGDGIALTPNSDDKTIIISTKVLGLLGINTYYTSGQLVIKVDDLYYNRWNETYNWYRSITDEDTDVYINKWLEIVDFLNNALSGTNILDEFVTRKTPQEIIGAKTFTLQIISTVAEGTAPLTVISTTKVENLNADLLDGYHESKFFKYRGWASAKADLNTIVDNSIRSLNGDNGSYVNSPVNYGNLISFGDYDSTSQYGKVQFLTSSSTELYVRNNFNGWKNWKQVAFTTDIPNVTDYYWADILISSTPSNNTSPTFANVYANAAKLNNYLFMNFSGEGIYLNDSGLHWHNKGTYTKSILLFTKDGLVGIGTASPGYKLDVAGTIGSNNIIINTTIKDHTNPMDQCLVINSSTVPSGTSLTLKNSPGIGFHIAGVTWASLTYGYNSRFNFINSSADGYASVAAAKFIKADSSDDYVLLGGGGHKSISSFQTTYDGRYVLKTGDTMTGVLTMNTGTGIQMKYTSSGNDPWMYPNGAVNYGIRYFEGDIDKMTLSATGNNNSISGADLCINGNGDGTVTIRGKNILTEATAPYVRRLYYRNDYEHYVVLLCKYGTNLTNTYHRASGKIYSEAGGGNRYVAADIDVFVSDWTSSMDSKLRFDSYGIAQMDLVTCTYGGSKYLAIRIVGALAKYVYFEGTSVNILFTPIYYYNENTGSVINSEVRGSISAITVGLPYSNGIKYALVNDNITGNAASATKVIVNQHTANNIEYPLIWSNLNNTNHVTENLLYKSYSHLTYNPSAHKITTGQYVANNSTGPHFTGTSTAGNWAFLRLNNSSCLWDIATRSTSGSGGLWLSRYKGLDNGIFVSAADTPKVGINNSSPSYALHVSGDIYATGWSRAGSGFYVEGKGVHYMAGSASGIGQIYLSNNNEFNWGASTANLYFNYRAAANGTTVTNYIWNAGSASSYATHKLGSVHIYSNGSSYNESIRIHPSAAGWHAIVLCGTDNTGDSGVSTNTWGIYGNSGTIYINKGNSSGATNSRAMGTSTGWTFGNTDLNSYALNAASFICASWVRTKGAAGWYNEDYGGGWYMTDSTWIRNFNSKPTYLSVSTYPSLVCNAQSGDDTNIRFDLAGSAKGYVGYLKSYGTFLYNCASGKRVYINDSGYFYTQSYINVGAGNEKNASNPPYVWGVNGSDNFMRTYATSSLSVGKAANANYATSAPAAANYGGTGDTTKIKIKINSTTSWMLSFVVTLYQGYKSSKIMVSGYNYGTNYWYEPEAVLLGDSNLATSISVYFGYDSAWNLWVGFDGGSYTGVSISDVTNGYTQISSLKGLFTISNVSSLTTLQKTVTATNSVNYASSAAIASTVTVNNSDADTTYKMVWHSGNTLYSTSGIYCKPSTDYLYASTFKSGNSTYGSSSIELYGSTPFIDFHHKNSTSDYTSRIIEGLSGQLTVTGKLRIGLDHTTSVTLLFYVQGTSYFSSLLTAAGYIDLKSLRVRVDGTGSIYGALYLNIKGTACTVAGTAGTTGQTLLLLGNNTATSTVVGQGANNAEGIIQLYNSNTGSVRIRCGTSDSTNHTLYLPGASGLFVYHTKDVAVGSYAIPIYIDNTGKACVCTSINASTSTSATYISSYRGYNAVSSLSAVPVSKRSVLATVSSNQTLLMSSLPSSGEEIHIIVKNTSSSSITISLTSGYINTTGRSITIQAGSYGEINCLNLGGTLYIRHSC